MLSSWLSRAWAVGFRPAIHALAGPAGQCRICQRWQAAVICEPCLSLWRTKARRCARCAIALAPDHAESVCVQCEDQSPEFDRAVAALDYAGPWPQLLVDLKFRGGTALARPLAALLAEAARSRMHHGCVVVPVPLSATRLKERGYNQSWLLARQVAKRLKLEARHDVLERSLHTPRLMSLSAEEREQQIRQAFQVAQARQKSIEGRDVAIVDDVMTTGATLNACSAVLLDAGARSVSAWVVARTPAPREQRLQTTTEEA